MAAGVLGSSLTKDGAVRHMRDYFMKRNWRVVPSFAFALVLVALGVWKGPALRRWLSDNDTLSKAPATAQPSVVAEGAQRIVVRDTAGRKAWEFAARRIVVSPDKVYCTATDVSRAVVYRDGRPFLKLKAQQVRLNQQTRDLEATGTVDASGPDGLTVRTQHATWAHETQRLTCPGDVRATLRGMTITTKAALYDVRAGKLHCPQAIHVTAHHAHFEATNVVADTKTSKITFNQGVHLAIAPL